jgi:hypothetical protein
METQSTSISPVQTATGPRTVEGKERSSRNAIKHGIFSKHLFLDDECRADFDKLHQGLREDFQPERVMEQLLVEQLSREFDRKLSQLERLQRARREHPPAPTIKIDLD